jgi:hypothetical protein
MLAHTVALFPGFHFYYYENPKPEGQAGTSAQRKTRGAHGRQAPEAEAERGQKRDLLPATAMPCLDRGHRILMWLPYKLVSTGCSCSCGTAHSSSRTAHSSSRSDGHLDPLCHMCDQLASTRQRIVNVQNPLLPGYLRGSLNSAWPCLV